MANTPSFTEDFSSKLSPIKHSMSIEEVVSPKLPKRTKKLIKEKPKVLKHPREFCENNNNLPSIMQKAVAELIGTYILVFIGCASALLSTTPPLNIVGVAIVWGFVLIAAIYAVAHVSGAHFNPAVTLAFAAGGKFSWKLVPMYVISQLLGSTLATLTIRVLYHDKDIAVTITQYKDSTSHLEAIAWEFIITFILMFVICATATDHRATKGVAGAAIGVTLVFNIIIAGPITGASMNPARSLGPAVVSGIYKNLWVFIVAPILGAMAAILIYSILRVPEPEKPEITKSIHNELYIDSQV